MIWILLGLVIVPIGGAVVIWLKKQNLAETANENIVHAIEDTKDKPGATVDDLKANLKEWNTTYVKDKAGNLVSQTDKAVEDYIKSKLAKTGRLKAEIKK